MDIEVILDAADAEAPGLRETARRYLEAEAQHLGVSLNPDSVAAREAEGIPALHVYWAAEQLLAHLAAQPGALGDDGPLMALARIGARGHTDQGRDGREHR